MQQQVALVPPCLSGFFLITIYIVRHQSKLRLNEGTLLFLPSLLFPAQKQLDITNGRCSFVPKTGDNPFVCFCPRKLPNWAFLLYLSHTPEVLSFVALQPWESRVHSLPPICGHRINGKCKEDCSHHLYLCSSIEMAGLGNSDFWECICGHGKITVGGSHFWGQR